MSGKTSGLGDDLYVGGYHIGDDVQDVAVASPMTPFDFTPITKSAVVRGAGKVDGSMDITVFMNSDTGQAHAALSTLPSTDRVMTYLRGQALGNPAACLVAKQLDYGPTRGADGSLLFKVAGQANASGLDWGIQLTPALRTDTTATDGTAVDNAAQTTFGGQGYLQVTALTGTDVTVSIGHSSDNSSWSALLTFAQTTGAHTAQRVAVSNVTTVKRYLRVSTATSAGFTSASFVVAFRRNEFAGVSF